MDQMNVSVDVTVTQDNFIDDGIPMEDIDDMEIDFLFSKCDNLTLAPAKKIDPPNQTTDVIELSDDDEKFNEVVVPKDDVQKVKIEANSEKKNAESPLKFIKILPKPPNLIKIPKQPAVKKSGKAVKFKKIVPKLPPLIKLTKPPAEVKNPKPLGFTKIIPERSVVNIQQKTPANRQFKIAIQSNIQIINNELSSVQPTVAYTVTTKPIVQPQTVNNKPKFIVIQKQTNPKRLQTQNVNGIHSLPKKDNPENKSLTQNNTILARLLNQNPKLLQHKPVSLLKKVQPTKDMVEKHIQYLKTLAATPSTSKVSEPPVSEVNNSFANTLNKTPNNQPKSEVEIKQELPEPQEMHEEVTNELEYKVSHAGIFKAMHDASGAIVNMVEDTPNYEQSHENMPNFLFEERQENMEMPNLLCDERLDNMEMTNLIYEESHENMELPNLLFDEIQENFEAPDYPDAEIQEILDAPYDPDAEIQDNTDAPDSLYEEMQRNFEAPYYPDAEMQDNTDAPDSLYEEMQRNFEAPDYPDAEIQEILEAQDYSDAEIQENAKTLDYLEESQENFNFIDKKLLAVTTVQLDDWSAILSNSSKYCSLCQTLFPSRAGLDEHQSLWHPLLVPCVEEEGYYCQLCDTSFHDKIFLERHLRAHKNIYNDSEFECFVCHDRFSTQLALRAHLNAAHLQSLKCHCGEEFSLQELLDEHIRTVHASANAPISDEPQNTDGKELKRILVQTTALYKCESCELHFTNYLKAKTHYVSCNKNKSIGRECQQCKKYFTRFDTTHKRQHKLNCRLKTYTVNSEQLQVISECPKCLLHYNIQIKHDFTHHVKYCKGPGAEYYECCGLRLTEMRYHMHQRQHDTARDFILIKYSFYDQNQNEGRFKTVEVDANSKPISKPEKTYNSLVQKTALFECETCKANFTAYFRAQKHYDQCENETVHKKCRYCSKFISSIHHRCQHLMKCKLKSYTVNANQLSVFSECPKCRLHYAESCFRHHVRECSGPKKTHVKCCGLKFTKHQHILHEKQHDNSDDREYIVLKYILNVPRDEKPQAEAVKRKEIVLVKRNAKSLKRKETEKQDDQNTSKCPICGLYYKRHRMKRHMLVHSNERPFKCSNCYYSTKWVGDLKRHEIKCRRNKNTVWYDCGICDYKTSHKNALHLHEKSHARERNDSDESERQEEQMAPRKRDKKIKKKLSLELVKKRKCPVCGMLCKKLGRHMRVHSAVTPFKCNKCYYSTKYPRRLKTHVKTCQGPKVNAVWHNCGICEFKTRYRNHLRAHISAHSVEGKNSDKRDSKPKKRKVEPQKGAVTIKEKFKQCPICRLDVKRNSLQRHMMIHSSERPYKCNKCYFSTKWSSYLIKHKANCQGNKINVIWYDCDICDYKSSTKRYLKNHIKTHERNTEIHAREREQEQMEPENREKKRKLIVSHKLSEVCRICGIRCNSLKKHMLVHSSKMPFKCNKCYFSTKRLFSLNKHKQICQGNDINKVWHDCSICDFKSTCASSLRLHINAHARECKDSDEHDSEAPAVERPQKRGEQVMQKVPGKPGKNEKRECHICGVRYLQLESHMIVHSSVTPFKCTKCYYSTKWSGDLRKHEKRCRGNGNAIWYECRICEFKSKNERGLEQHTLSHASDINTEECEDKHGEQNKKILSCHICGLKLKEISDLKRHMLVHSSERPFKCNNCYYSSKYAPDLRKHKENCRGNSINAIWHSCSICEFKTRSNAALQKHIRSHDLECDIPDELISEIPNPMDEGQKTEPGKREEVKEIILPKKQCDICGLYFKENLLKNHMLLHSSERPFKCDDCFYSSKYAHDLRKHKKICRGIDTNAILYSCNICEFKSTSNAALHKHIIAHDLEIKKSDELDSEVPNPTDEEQKMESPKHIIAHDLEFKKIDQLDFEVPILTDEEQKMESGEREDVKPILPSRKQCQICPLSFKENAELKKHMIVHSSVRPFKCNNCYYSSKYAPHLKKHKENCHGNDINAIWHSCSFCEFKAKSNNALQQHISSHNRECENSDKLKSKIPYPSDEEQTTEPGEMEEEKQIILPRKQCNICSLSFEENELKKHMMLHSLDRPFKCNKCYYSAKYARHLRKHKKRCQGNDINAIWYSCSICEFKTRSKPALKRHSIGHDLEFKNSDELYSEVQIPKIKAKRKKRECRICGISCLDLNRHMMVHSTERPFKCNKCFFSTKQPYTLLIHKEKCHGNKINTVWHDCSICDFKTKTLFGLKRHTLSHGLERNDSEEHDSDEHDSDEHDSDEHDSDEHDSDEHDSDEHNSDEHDSEVRRKKGHKVVPRKGENKLEQKVRNNQIRKIRKCHICGLGCIYLAKHMLIHSSVRPFKCSRCYFSSKRSYELLKHKKKCKGKTNTGWFDCKICEFKTKRKNLIQRHTATHALECENSEANDSKVPGEAAKRKQIKKVPRKLTECRVCGLHYSDLTQHMVVHSTERPFKCDKCYFTTKWQSDLKKHKINCKGNEKDAIWHDCHMCDYKSQKIRDLKKHAKTHESDTSNILDSEVREERQKLDKRKSVNCQICGLNCIDLARHMLVHSSDRPHKCDKCFYSSKRLCDLEKHKKNCQGTSIDSVLYDCNICDFKSPDGRGIGRHMASHALESNNSNQLDSAIQQEEVPLSPEEVEPKKTEDIITKQPKTQECFICGHDVTDLNKHMRVHSTVRPFKCNKCHYLTKWSSALTKHKKKCRGIRSDVIWHDCNVCEYKSTCESTLKNHIKSHARECNISDAYDLEAPMELACNISDEHDLEVQKELACNISDAHDLEVPMELACSNSDAHDLEAPMELACNNSDEHDLEVQKELACIISDEHDLEVPRKRDYNNSDEQDFVIPKKRVCNDSSEHDLEVPEKGIPLPCEEKEGSLTSEEKEVLFPSEKTNVPLPSSEKDNILSIEEKEVTLPSDKTNILLPSKEKEFTLPSEKTNDPLPSEEIEETLTSEETDVPFPSKEIEVSLPSEEKEVTEKSVINV